MRTLNWNPKNVDDSIMSVAMERLGRVAELVADKAREIVPVNTGALKASIRVSRGPGLHMYRVYAGNETAFYSRIVEFSNKHGKHSYMRPALARSKKRGRKILQGEEE